MKRGCLSLGMLVLLANPGCGGGGVAGGGGGDRNPGPTDVSYVLDVSVTPQDADGPQDTSPDEGTFEFIPCSSGSDCPTGFCVEGPDGVMVCAPDCVEGVCPPGWACKQVANLQGDAVFVCLPEVQRLCRPCRHSEECRPSGVMTKDLCVSFGHEKGSFCGRDCSDSKTCPAGYECEEVKAPDGSQAYQCLPASKECECTSDFIEHGYSTECWIANEHGVCKGIRACMEKGLSACSALIPAPEACNDADDDCDGQTDEPGAEGCTTYYRDADGDGWGVGTDFQCLCSPNGPYKTPQAGDCDDANAAVHPTEAETCNGLDDDCDGTTDPEGVSGCVVYFADADQDGYGALNSGRCLCAPDATHTVTQGGDCNDSKAGVHPGAEEGCTGHDEDCDGQTDEEGAKGCLTYYFDQDGDSYGVADNSKCLCGPSGKYAAAQPGDCHDGEVSIFPGAKEVCDGKDNNCNDQVDEGGVCGTVYKIGINPDDGGGTGACGCNGICEDNLNLSMGLHLRDFLDADTANPAGGGSWQVFMTRTDNSNPSLASRVAYLNNSGVHRAVSISCNTTPEPCPNEATGTETYIKSGADANTNDLAKKVQAQVVAHFQTTDRGLKVGSYYVLLHTNMPHVFVFPGFLTNTSEANKLNTDSWRKEAARGMLHGIQQHFGYGEFNP